MPLTNQPGATVLAAKIRQGELTPRDAVDAAISRIEKLDAHVNAVAVCDFERASETAQAMTKTGPQGDQPLFGVPMTIKESFAIAGLPTTFGHAKHAGFIAQNDADVVRRLKAAGVIFVGKTNVPPDLSDWQSNNPVYGRTNNPHDHDRSAGGSSGGSAAAVAAGMVPCEYGTDIGGSVRVPAHFNGIWGHKTSWGLVSREGHQSPAFGTNSVHDGALSVAGPLARNSEDLALLMRLTAQLPLATSPKPLTQMRLLALLDHPSSAIDDAVRGPTEAALSALEAAGVTIDRTSELLPDLARQQEDYLRMLNVAMARGAPAPDGTTASAADWFELLDVQTNNEHAWRALLERYDFVLAPPAPILAFEHVEGALFSKDITVNGAPVPAAGGLAWAGLATFPNLPSTVLPIGESGGLPCGMQVMGPRWSDLDCIAAARAIGVILGG